MEAVLNKRRLLIAVLALIAVGSLIWMLLAKYNAGKIPTRGVFVITDSIFKLV